MNVAVSFNQLGLAYSRVGDDERAVAAFLDGLKLDPKRCELLSNLSMLYKQLGMHDLSRSTALQCDISSPLFMQTVGAEQYAAYLNNLGTIELESGNAKVAHESFVKALESLPGGQINPSYSIIANNIDLAMKRILEDARIVEGQ